MAIMPKHTKKQKNTKKIKKYGYHKQPPPKKKKKKKNMQNKKNIQKMETTKNQI